METVSSGMLEEWNQWIYSITTGLVKENWDDTHPGMVKVEYFLGTEGKNVTGWIPTAAPYAYKNCGIYMLPEIGSEVVIGFNMGDRNCPIVLGCLWNQENPLPQNAATEKNTIKRIRTKGGCEVVFEEAEGKEAIEVHTPAGLFLRLEDENQRILVADQDKKNGMAIDGNEGAVKLFGEKKLTLEVSGKSILTLDGNENSAWVKADNIKAEASKSYQVSGQNLKLEGNQTEVKGNSQLTIQSGGIAQVKGTTVKIN